MALWQNLPTRLIESVAADGALLRAYHCHGYVLILVASSCFDCNLHDVGCLVRVCLLWLGYVTVEKAI